MFTLPIPQITAHLSSSAYFTLFLSLPYSIGTHCGKLLWAAFLLPLSCDFSQWAAWQEIREERRERPEYFFSALALP
jgi:hypothetical protein